MVWAYAVLNVRDMPLLERLSRRARASAHEFGPQEFANTAWACSNLIFSDAPLLQALAAAAIESLPQWHIQDLQNTAWAYYMLSRGDLQGVLFDAFQTRGKALDGKEPPGPHVPEHRWRVRSNDPWEPWVNMLLPDVAVVMKPAAWQVDTDDVGGAVRRLSHWVDRRFRRAPVVHSHCHRYGIIHRLDTPSSGLIAVARTFEGYFSLMFQISTGGIAREYNVLSYGLMESSCSIEEPMFHRKSEGPTVARVSDVGKAANTYLRAAAHARHSWVELRELRFSVIAIRIGTGRRHQIRTHISHFGHATVLDAKYTPDVWEAEALTLYHSLDPQVIRGALHSRRFKTFLDTKDADTDSILKQLYAGAQPNHAWQHDPRCLASSGSELFPITRPERRRDAQGRDPERCLVCGERGHWARHCPTGDRCLVCGRHGHWARDCPEGGQTCLSCGKIGHFQEECPELDSSLESLRTVCFDHVHLGHCRFGLKCRWAHATRGPSPLSR